MNGDWRLDRELDREYGELDEEYREYRELDRELDREYQELDREDREYRELDREDRELDRDRGWRVRGGGGINGGRLDSCNGGRLDSGAGSIAGILRFIFFLFRFRC